MCCQRATRLETAPPDLEATLATLAGSSSGLTALEASSTLGTSGGGTTLSTGTSSSTGTSTCSSGRVGSTSGSTCSTAEATSTSTIVSDRELNIIYTQQAKADSENSVTYVDLVIESTVLSNSDESGLVVGSGVDRRETVSTSRETFSDIGSQDTTLSSSVETLEEGELRGVGGLSLSEGLQGIDDDVRVADDVTRAIDLLRSREVVGVRVDKVTSLKVLDRHRDRERGVGLDNLAVDRVGELR